MVDDMIGRCIEVNAATMRAYRECMERLGPRHRIAARWEYDLGWTWAPGVLDAFLAQDTPETRWHHPVKEDGSLHHPWCERASK